MNIGLAVEKDNHGRMVVHGRGFLSLLLSVDSKHMAKNIYYYQKYWMWSHF